MKVYGLREVPVMIDNTIPAVVRFTVADVSRPVVSIGKLVQNEFGVMMGKRGSHLCRDGRAANLAMKGNTFYLSMQILESDRQVGEPTMCAAAETEALGERVDDRQMPASSSSDAVGNAAARLLVGGEHEGEAEPPPELPDSFKEAYKLTCLRPYSSNLELKTRLRELKEPIYGTKDEL